jgi:H+/Cl- antiporter ClcA
MHQVFGICRKEGGYHIPHLGKSLGLFFAPIVFGGAIGPEAGIAGFAAAGFTAVLDKTRIGGTGALSAGTHPFRRAIRTLLDTGDEAQASKEAKETLQELPLRKLWKVLLWILAAIFFVLGWACVSHALGSAGEMPRFEGIDYATADWGAGIVALLLGYAFALFALAAQKVAASISSAIGPDPLKKALLAGLVLGGLACILPDLTFSGQDDIVDLIDTWQSWAPALLILVAFVKICMTKMCVALDWTGGEFFPTIFCGVALGYAVASLMGADPLLPVAVAAGAAVGGWTRKPILSTAVLALCFPPIALPVVLAASWIAAKLPHP